MRCLTCNITFIANYYFKFIAIKYECRGHKLGVICVFFRVCKIKLIDFYATVEIAIA